MQLNPCSGEHVRLGKMAIDNLVCVQVQGSKAGCHESIDARQSRPCTEVTCGDHGPQRPKKEGR